MVKGAVTHLLNNFISFLGSDVSVWMRNIQLSILAIPLGVMVCATKHGSAISENGFFHGYDAFVAYLVALNATGGLLVAVVVKYADNILKVHFNR